MLASTLNWCTVRRAWAMLLELCIFDDIAVFGQLCSNLEQGKKEKKLCSPYLHVQRCKRRDAVGIFTRETNKATVITDLFK